MSHVVYETEEVRVEQFVERSVDYSGWVSKFRVITTILRTVVTKLNVRLLAPDRSTVSQYSIPTRYVEKEEVRGVSTVFVGIEPVGGAAPAGATIEAPTTVEEKVAVRTAG